ncbi:MAG: 3-dehydroquinate synthase [Pseudobutyrivibrio sp.]|nr:3-dehydroquinate synthase [Pseudobutyrivibrio sp.]
MNEELLINYENQPCYKIVFRPDFNDLITVFNQEVGHTYDNICIVTDSNVAELYLSDVISTFKKLDVNVSSFSFPAGEKSKNLDMVKLLYEHLIIKRFTRNSLLVALGGGVVGDLTGFAAATFLRGIDFIQIPTTLLSQVDSSVGGKTGVDFNKYKNMVGAFYMPRLVYMNLNTIKSLDDDNFACGMAEVIKSALIADSNFYKWLKDNAAIISSKDYEALKYTVSKCCEIKGHVVEIDPKEKGIRAYLNFGHSLGHAIEKLSNFKLGHGQCVSLGMVCAMHLSNRLGYVSNIDVTDVISTLSAYNLPITISDLSATDILEASKSDKKMKGNKIKFIILKALGEADSYMDFSDEDLLWAIEKVLG